MPSIHDLERIAEIEFADIIAGTMFIDHKLRIFLTDSSFIDVNLSQRLPDKFGFHWERMNKTGEVFRYDNFPDPSWKNVSTYPYHFHNSTQEAVEATPFPLDVIKGFRAFMEFVRNKVRE